MFQAMDRIWRNQNPPDCSKAQYIISTGHHQGFGSEIDFMGVVLAMALDTGEHVMVPHQQLCLMLRLDTGRVLLQEGGWTWRYENKHCQEQGRV